MPPLLSDSPPTEVEAHPMIAAAARGSSAQTDGGGKRGSGDPRDCDRSSSAGVGADPEPAPSKV